MNLADIETTDLGLVQVEDPGLGVEGTEIEDRSPVRYSSSEVPAPRPCSQRDRARTKLELDSDPVATASLSVKTPPTVICPAVTNPWKRVARKWTSVAILAELKLEVPTNSVWVASRLSAVARRKRSPRGQQIRVVSGASNLDWIRSRPPAAVRRDASTVPQKRLWTSSMSFAARSLGA